MRPYAAQYHLALLHRRDVRLEALAIHAHVHLAPAPLENARAGARFGASRVNGLTHIEPELAGTLAIVRASQPSYSDETRVRRGIRKEIGRVVELRGKWEGPGNT